MICDSISKSVASIYHGRVRYASTSGEGTRTETRAPADHKTRIEPTRTGPKTDTGPAGEERRA
jgi:hypothetical protein